MTGSATTPIRVGIVGASATRGWAGVAHIPAIHSLEAFEIRAVSTTRIASARATAGRLGIDLAFDNHQSLVIHPDVDLVVVAVKVPEHHRIVSDALAAGKMVYCEWPLARNLAEAEELAALASERQARTLIGLQGSLHPPVRYVADLVRQGVIGRPISTSIRAHPPEEMWRGRFEPPFEFMARAEHGATFLTIALGHALEPLARVLGSFESLSAVVANQRGDGIRASNGMSLAKDTPDEIVVAGILEGGIIASLHYSAGLPAGPAMVWEIQGTDGSLRVETASGYLQFGDFALTCCRGRGPVERLTLPPAYVAPNRQVGPAAAGVACLYAQLAADIRDGTSKAPDFAVALARHRVLDAITRSAATGRREQVARPSDTDH